MPLEKRRELKLWFSLVLVTLLPSGLLSTEIQSTTQQELRERIFNVLDFGAVGDGHTLNTQSLQKAIDACTEAGGGLLRVPSGNYVTGTLSLKSNVILSLEHGSSILGSMDPSDYPTDKLRPAREGQSHCLFYAEDIRNFSLEGLGIIDGRGKPEHFPKKREGKRGDQRPRLLRFENCEDFTLSGLTYKDPAFWGIHLVDCRDIHIDAVTIRFHENQPNNDGLDLDGCERVLIENCNIKSGDDAICLKSSLNPCRDITVRNCRVSSHTAPLKFGTSSKGGFINVNISNCYFYDSPMGAIKLQIVDGGRMENVNISRLEMKNVGCPLFIRLGNRGSTFGAKNEPNKPEEQTVGSIKGIHISDIKATITFEDRESSAARISKIFNRPSEVKTGPLTEQERAKAGPIMITGIPGHLIEDVVLENITISYPGTGTAEEAQNIPPEDISRYPEQFFFGVLPAWGAYIRHAKNVEFKNVTLTTRNSDNRERLILENVQGFQES